MNKQEVLLRFALIVGSGFAGYCLHEYCSVMPEIPECTLSPYTIKELAWELTARLEDWLPVLVTIIVFVLATSFVGGFVILYWFFRLLFFREQTAQTVSADTVVQPPAAEDTSPPPPEVKIPEPEVAVPEVKSKLDTAAKEDEVDNSPPPLDSYGMPIYTPERYNKGSEYAPITSMPGCQFGIYQQVHDGKYQLIGQGVRFQNHCVTANHNLTGFDEVWFGRGGNYQKVYVIAVDELPEDIAILRVDSTVWSTLGIATAKIPSSCLCTTTYVKVTDGTKETMGMLKPGPNFGMVTYSGSTAPGFSGAPYLINKSVVGIHTGALSVNIGVDSQYIAAFIKQESTEDFIIQQMYTLAEKGSRFIASQSPFDSGEFVVKVGNKYHQLEFSDHKDLVKYFDIKDESDQFLSKDYVQENYDDSGNDLRPSAFAGAVGPVEFSRIVRKRNQAAREERRSKSKDTKKENTDGPAQMSVAQSEALLGMLKFFEEQKKEAPEESPTEQ